MTVLNQILQRILVGLFVLVAFTTNNSFAQGGVKNGTLGVFLDMTRMADEDYIRQEIPIVVYVRDKEHADVHIIMNRYSSGTTGYTYNISFIGYGKFEDKNYELNYWAPSTNTSYETRKGYTDAIKMGLAPFIAVSSLSSRMDVVYDTIARADDEVDLMIDPWNYWVFETYGGYDFSKEDTRSNLHIRYGFSADRITAESKTRIRPFGNYYERKFDTDDGMITSIRVRNGLDSYYIKSIGDHFGIGVFGEIDVSTYDNLKFGGDLSPAIEYSLFPYEEATRRSVTLSWKLGGVYNNYVEETIFNKTEEFLLEQALVLASDFRQPWGTIRAGLEGSHHFHDFASNRAEVFARVSFRVFEGLALNFSSGYELINDQVNIPKADLSLEEILLEQRRRATSYEFDAEIGLSYTFGSRITGVFNPRLN